MAKDIAGSRKPRVGVVGAGAAGLRAAQCLLNAGVQVTLFEARDRVGGRIAQSTLMGSTIDLGPNWLQNSESDPLLELAKETETTVHLFPEYQNMFANTGDILSTSDSAEVQEAFWDIISDAFHFSNEQSDSIRPLQSLMDFVKQEIQQKFSHESANEANRKRQLLLQTADMWGAFVGNPIESQSLKFCWLEKGIEHDEVFVASTLARVLERMSAPVIKKADVRYSHAVTQISNRSSKEVELIFADRPPETFDEVIVTVPLGCLKVNEPIFSPPLPSRLLQAISSIGYGCLDKVFIKFPAAFWQAHKDTKLNKRDVQESDTHSSSGEGDNHCPPSVFYWLRPSYSLATNPTQWTQVCVNLAALPAATAHSTLLFYVYGPCSQHIARIVSTTPKEKLDEHLLDFFRPYISRLPNYASDSADCKPVSVLASAWANDKYAGHGSYSNFPIGIQYGDKDIECIREGLPERHIWFAGEHTAPFADLGTVAGAYKSGQAVAERLVQKWQT